MDLIENSRKPLAVFLCSFNFHSIFAARIKRQILDL